MNITSYRFGKIDIDGRTYTSDVMITPERGVDAWWRKEGHRMGPEEYVERLLTTLSISGTWHAGDEAEQASVMA